MKEVIVITGPTACGKTLTAVALAKKIGGEIISADSMQIYTGMDIGTAKPTSAEMDGIPHHLIDICSPSQVFSASLYQQLARKAVDEIASRGNIPIITGGTGFYINAAIYDGVLSPAEENNKKVRTSLRENDLYEYLKQIDPISAERIHPNNIKRVKRAVEYYEIHAKPLSENIVAKIPIYKAFQIMLYRDRKKLYEAINKRVDLMIQSGLVAEVKRLTETGAELTAIQALGYKELLPYLRGECLLEEAVEQIKTRSRRYAKRQLTWFKNQMDCTEILMDGKSYSEAADEIIEKRGKYG